LNNKNTTYSLTEIGETFNITRERVRQVKQRALNKLKSKSRATVLRTYL
jgi:RNA polymerase primary sigma factor